MRTSLFLLALLICTSAAAQTAQTPLNLAGAFNIDAVCGPGEFRVCLADGSHDLAELFGGLTAGNGAYVLGQSNWLVANGYGPGFAYSLPGQPNHPVYLSGDQGLPDDGVIVGADRLYHASSLVGNDTLRGNRIETADPGDHSLLPNAVCVGAMHNRTQWQIPSVVVELPAAQKRAYNDVNFVLAAMDMGNRARNVRIVALYGSDGGGEEILYSFSTDAGGSGPLMDEPAPAGFTEVLAMTQVMSVTTGATGAVRAGTARLFAFEAPLPLDSTRTLWGFRIEDANPALNWAGRGLTIFAATATGDSDAPAYPIADAGADQVIIDSDEDGLEDVQLDGSASADTDGVLLTHVWTEEGIEIACGIAPVVSLPVAPHTVTLTVADEDGLTDSDTVLIDVAPLPAGTPVADAGPDQSVADTTNSGGAEVALDGSGSYDPDGTIVSAVWTDNGVAIAAGQTVAVTLAVGVHDITLTVTDNDGLTRTDDVTVTVAAYQAPAVYHVDAAGGDDANDGGEAAPFRTISKAVAAVKYGDTIVVHEGIYRGVVTLPASGYAGSPITIVAAEGERPVVSGAGEVAGWTACSPAEVNNNPRYANIYRADIAWKPSALFEDNQPLTKARTPWRHPADGGTTTSLTDPVHITEPGGYWSDGGEVFMWIRSGTTHHHREILTHTGSTITFTDLGYGWTPDAEDLYWLQNKVELIDEPGDWVVADNGDGTWRVFLWPLAGEDPTGHLVEGSANFGPFLIAWGNRSHWVIDGLEIRHSTENGAGSWSAGAHHITIRNCMIHHNGGSGIYGRCNHYGTYYRNYVGHNAGGISVGDAAGNVLIEENEVDTNTHDGVIVNNDNVVLRRNYIHGHFMWGHADNIQTYNDVDNLLLDSNFIFNAGQSIMMEDTDGVTYRNNAIVGCHAYMVIAGHNNTFNVTLDSNTLMFPGYAPVNTSGDFFNFHDNIFFLGHSGGAYGRNDTHTGFASDYNLFYTADGLAETVANVMGTWNATLPTVQSHGLELHSRYGSPQWVNAPVSYHRALEHRVTDFTPTRVIMDDGALAGLAVGDHVEIDWDGVVRTITAVGPDWIEVDVPKPEMTTFKACFIVNWKDNADYTLDLRPGDGSPAIAAGSDGSTLGSSIDTVAFRESDFDGDGVRDVPRWGAGESLPPATPGDADADGDVDLDDFVILKQNFGTPAGATGANGDFDGDGDVDLDDFVILKNNFGRQD
ncbi:MAG: DUF1565 domain-containing protein [Planctomycetes bacterium]|nr:DUF1565 domain-containing protein [Planctomycetota bacterium]